MARRILALVLALHAAIHLIGFVVPWRLAVVDGFAYRTTALGGAIELGPDGARLVGLVWLVLAVGFAIAAAGTWRGATRAPAAIAVLAVGSFAVCALGLPETAAGAAVNVAILALLGVAQATGARLATSR